MARHERDFRHPEKPLSLDELLLLLGDQASTDERSREDAIACYLSASDGWREAMKQLGGTFAERSSELRQCKED